MARQEISKPVRVIVVEDSAAVREAVTSEFAADARFEVVGEAATVAEARELLAKADVAIIDLGLPDGSGADLIPELRSANPAGRAIVLSTTVLSRFADRAFLKLLYGTQIGVDPPTFILSINHPVDLHFSYKRYLENQLREEFGFRGTPIVLKVRGRRH